MKNLTLTALLIACIALGACSKDSEVEAFITEFDATTNEMVAKINENPSSAGIEAAHKAFEARKPSLKAKFDSFKNAREMQVSKEVQKKMMDSADKNGKALAAAITNNQAKFVGDQDALKKFQAMMEDYAETFKM